MLPVADFRVVAGKYPQGRCKTCSKSYQVAYRLARPRITVACVKCGRDRSLAGRRAAATCRSCSNGPRGNRRPPPHVSGRLSARWKGGVTPIAQSIRTSETYTQWRASILYRDSYECQLCHKRGGKLHVDHYPRHFASILAAWLESDTGSADDYPDFWAIANARTLCVPCHLAHGTKPKIYKRSLTK